MNNSAFEEATKRLHSNAIYNVYIKLYWDLYGSNNDDPFFTNEKIDD